MEEGTRKYLQLAGCVLPAVTRLLRVPQLQAQISIVASCDVGELGAGQMPFSFLKGRRGHQIARVVGFSCAAFVISRHSHHEAGAMSSTPSFAGGRSTVEAVTGEKKESTASSITCASVFEVVQSSRSMFVRGRG